MFCREDLTGWQDQCSPSSSSREGSPPCKKPYHTYSSGVPTPLLGPPTATAAPTTSANAAAAAEQLLGRDAAALKQETSRRARLVSHLVS